MNLTTCKASRKADREAIAAEMIRIAEQFGATVTRRDEPLHKGWCGAGIALSFKLNGVGANVDVNDLHGGDSALISWYNDYSNGNRITHNFAAGFCIAVGDGAIHFRPHHKATSGGRWDLLAARLQAGLRHAAKETAFVPN